MSLRDQAAAAINPAAPSTTELQAPRVEPPVDAPLPDIEYTDPIIDVAQVPVHVAFARVMADVQSIGKEDRREDKGGKYNFRGVDRVVNAVGPALRRHGVLCVPVKVYDVEYRETRTSSGTVMQDCTLKVQWLVVGPMGDVITELLESAGQANDTADKGTSKAMSVAQRVLFLTALHIPTQDPTIDTGHDRGERPTPKAKDYRDEVLHPGTSVSRMQQIWKEIRQHGLARVEIVNEVGADEALEDLLARIGAERKQPGGGA